MSGLSVLLCLATISALPGVELHQDDQTKTLAVIVDGQEKVAYQYASAYALPHYWPVRSPSGKLLTVQHPDPYPHHRSLWIADNVQAGEGPAVDFYHCWKNYRKQDQPDSGFRHFLTHRRLAKLKVEGSRALIEAELQWVVNDTNPVLDELRKLRVHALGNGEYLLDLEWELKPSSGPVNFLSDSVHYAWPFVRMHPQFSGDHGGTITSDQGHRGQADTNGKAAKWIDYCNTVQGETEGLAVFIYPDGHPHQWLTREYGTFGPRRWNKLDGTKFTLKSGESLQGRVGILVHRGDVNSGQVSQRYQQYIEGRL